MNRKVIYTIITLSLFAIFTISFLPNMMIAVSASTSDLSIPYEGLVLRWLYSEKFYHRGNLTGEWNEPIIYVYRERISPTIFEREQISPARIVDMVDITTREVLSGPSMGMYTNHWIETGYSIGDLVKIANVTYVVKAKNVSVNLPSVTPERLGARISCFELECKGEAGNFSHTDLFYFDMRTGIMVLGETIGVYILDPDFTVQASMILEEIESDKDEDRLTDLEELFVTLTDPTKIDTDDDGLDDQEEVNIQTDPLNIDSDSDELKDGEEVNTHGTDPLDDDTDGDGLHDGFEVSIDTNPLKTDSDRDFWNDSVDVMPNNMLVPNALIFLSVIIPIVGIMWWWRKRGAKAEIPPTVPTPPAYPPPPTPQAKRFCIGCGAEIPADAIYCPKCGQKQG